MRAATATAPSHLAVRVEFTFDIWSSSLNLSGSS
jgi:hypothetical protein